MINERFGGCFPSNLPWRWGWHYFNFISGICFLTLIYTAQTSEALHIIWGHIIHMYPAKIAKIVAWAIWAFRQLLWPVVATHSVVPWFIHPVVLNTPFPLASRAFWPNLLLFILVVVLIKAALWCFAACTSSVGGLKWRYAACFLRCQGKKRNLRKLWKLLSFDLNTRNTSRVKNLVLRVWGRLCGWAVRLRFLRFFNRLGLLVKLLIKRSISWQI